MEETMEEMGRRHFLKVTGAMGLGAALPKTASAGDLKKRNPKIVDYAAVIKPPTAKEPIAVKHYARFEPRMVGMVLGKTSGFIPIRLYGKSERPVYISSLNRTALVPLRKGHEKKLEHVYGVKGGKVIDMERGDFQPSLRLQDPAVDLDGKVIVALVNDKKELSLHLFKGKGIGYDAVIEAKLLEGRFPNEEYPNTDYLKAVFSQRAMHRGNWNEVNKIVELLIGRSLDKAYVYDADGREIQLKAAERSIQKPPQGQAVDKKNFDRSR